MDKAVKVEFDCLPFRRVGDMGLPIDAPEEQRALWKRFRQALEQHGVENTYFLYNADCVFQLANSEDGILRIVFEATVKTDSNDQKPLEIDIATRLATWHGDEELTSDVKQFFHQLVKNVVRDEFQLFIDAGNLEKALAEKEQYLREWNKNKGFVGMDI